jgi:hypothetical protein
MPQQLSFFAYSNDQMGIDGSDAKTNAKYANAAQISFFSHSLKEYKNFMNAYSM